LIRDVPPDRGPVLLQIEYCIDPANRVNFLRAVAAAAGERKRDGAYDWRLFEDPAADGIFLESFVSDSWSGHLRQHERVTKADQRLEHAVQQFHIGDGPRVRHLIAIN